MSFYPYPYRAWPYFVIITNGLFPWERNRVHDLIKANSNSWWHHFPDVWIVAGGQSADWWRDLFGEVFTSDRASVLVFQISDRWAARASRDKLDWLVQALGGTIVESPPKS